MERNYFERLSAELITSILHELPSIHSLYSLIRASPKTYQVFLASKERILVSLMRRSIRPATFIDALAAVQASQLKDSGPDRKAVLAFLRKYENKRHKTIREDSQHLSTRTAVSLCRLYQSMQYFIEDLTCRSNFYLRRCRDSTVQPKNGSGGLLRGQRGLFVDRDHQYAPLSDVVRISRSNPFLVI